jgi:hypothetical protein
MFAGPLLCFIIVVCFCAFADLCVAVCCGAQLANILSTESLFYACIFPFIAFFGAFAFILYPLRDTLHPTGNHTFLDFREQQWQQQLSPAYLWFCAYEYLFERSSLPCPRRSSDSVIRSQSVCTTGDTAEHVPSSIS